MGHGASLLIQSFRQWSSLSMACGGALVVAGARVFPPSAFTTLSRLRAQAIKLTGFGGRALINKVVLSGAQNIGAQRQPVHQIG